MPEAAPFIMAADAGGFIGDLFHHHHEQKIQDAKAPPPPPTQYQHGTIAMLVASTKAAAN